MTASKPWILISVLGSLALVSSRIEAAAEVKLSKDFLDGVVEKLPPCPFDKPNHYRGRVHSFRLNTIDPRDRRLLIACQIEGQFRPTVKGPISERVGRGPSTPEGWASSDSRSKRTSTSNRAPPASPDFASRLTK